MTEHEVPTHVQAEDRVVLWFTFPQIVAMTAVCALGYGMYRYAPVGPSEVRMGLAVVFALFGLAMVVGKVGGRRLPVVLADLLRFGVGPRRYAGPAVRPGAQRASGASDGSEERIFAEGARVIVSRWRRRRCQENPARRSALTGGSESAGGA